MTKKNFLFLVWAVASGLIFALGMCMCLLPEWNAFKLGVALTILGVLSLLAIGTVRWVMAGKPMVKPDWRKAGKTAYCVAAVLVLGTGMAMIMAFEAMMVSGILVGAVGMLLCLGMIPVLKGLR